MLKHIQLKCAKCGALTGDDWSQCGGECPVIGSPHFNQKTRDHHNGGLIPKDDEDESGTISSPL